MARWSRTLLALAAAALLAAPSAFAQGGGASSTGSITGEVKDDQGGVLPGVTVTATSPAQLGALTAVTNEAGIYRFPAVPPGAYALNYELAGFGPVTRDGIRITLGFNAQVNVSLRVATLQETVTVSGESPVIDTSATRLQTNFDQDRLNVAARTPATCGRCWRRRPRSRSTASTSAAPRWARRPPTSPTATRARTVRWSRASTPPRAPSAAGFYLDYGSFEEVFIGAAANSAEMPNSGVLTQFVSKSGGNSPSLSVYYDMEDESIQSDNLELRSGHARRPARSIRPDGNRLASYKNTNIGVGFPILRDRIWAFGAFLDQRNSVAAPPAGSFLDGTPFDTKLRNYTGKAHLPDEPEQQVRGLPAARHQDRSRTAPTAATSSGAPIHITADSTTLQDSPSWVYKGEWNGTHRRRTCSPSSAPASSATTSASTATPAPRATSRSRPTRCSGGGRDWELRRRRNQYTGALSYFKDNFAGGSHNLKFGGEYLDEEGHDALEPGLRRQRHPLRSRRPHRPAHGHHGRPGAPLQQRGVDQRPGDDQLLRHRHLDGQPPDDEHRRPVRSLPRVAARAVVHGRPVRADGDGASRAVEHRHLQPHRAAHRRELRPHRRRQDGGQGQLRAASTSTPASTWPTRSTRTPPTSTATHLWNDLNNDRIFQDGEQGALQTRFGGVANAFIDPDLENAYTDEASVFVERAVMTDLGVRAGFVWKKDKNGWQQFNTLRPVQRLQRAGDGHRSRDRTAWPATATTARCRRFNLDPALLTRVAAGSHQHRRLRGHLQDPRVLDQQALLQPLGPERLVLVHLDPRVREPLLQQPLRHAPSRTSRSSAATRPTRTRRPTTSSPAGTASSAARSTPAGASHVTPVWKIQSGAPYGRFFNATLNYGTADHAGRADRHPPSGHRVGVRLPRREAAAVRDQGPRRACSSTCSTSSTRTPPSNINWRSGASFEKATTVLGPRIAKFGVKFDW